MSILQAEAIARRLRAAAATAEVIQCEPGRAGKRFAVPATYRVAGETSDGQAFSFIDYEVALAFVHALE